MDFTFSAENETALKLIVHFRPETETKQYHFRPKTKTKPGLSLPSDSSFEHSVHLALPACCSDFVKKSQMGLHDIIML